MICTIYSHRTGFDRIIEILQNNYPKANLTVSQQDEFQVAELEIRGGVFASSGNLKIRYRQREKPSYQILEEDICPLSQNLKGLYGFVSSLPTQNEQVKELFLRKIVTINCEFSIMQEKGQIKDLRNTILAISRSFDAFLFVQPDTIISRSSGQHFLDKNLKLIVDGQGNCEVDSINVEAELKYFESELNSILDDQQERRKKSEEICLSKNIPIYKNPNSLFVESETTVKLKTKDEVVDRAIALCYLELKSESAEKSLLSDFDKKYSVMSKLTPLEKSFALNEKPTEQEMVNANWRAESFHLLLWSLGYIDTLNYPSELCNIGDTAGILFSKTEQKFREKATLRSKAEILDQADLILRYNWACVSARIQNQQAPGGLNPSVVYERHYALNWLICFQNQEWDNVTTNT